MTRVAALLAFHSWSKGVPVAAWRGRARHQRLQLLHNGLCVLAGSVHAVGTSGRRRPVPTHDIVVTSVAAVAAVYYHPPQIPAVYFFWGAYFETVTPRSTPLDALSILLGAAGRAGAATAAGLPAWTDLTATAAVAAAKGEL